MSERIAVIGCGGTIAMEQNEAGALAPSHAANELIAQVPGIRDFDIELDVEQLFNKDSTNVNVADWQQLIGAIVDRHDSYDGILVTHGTDTMVGTATAVALAIGQDLAIPIAFTGSQLPMNHHRSDARQNLASALEVLTSASKQEITETMIVFSDSVLRAARTAKTSPDRFSAFDSPAFPHLADLTASDEIVFSPLARKRGSTGFAIRPHTNFDGGIFVTEADPGTDPEIVLAAAMSPRCTALILQSLGAGNIPNEGEHSYVPIVEQVLAVGKPVILTSPFLGGEMKPEIYETGMAALEAGAGHAGNMTAVAARVKLMWLMGQGIRDPREVSKAMLRPYVGEVDWTPSKA